MGRKKYIRVNLLRLQTQKIYNCRVIKESTRLNNEKKGRKEEIENVDTNGSS